jgi:hypothetical protein
MKGFAGMSESTVEALILVAVVAILYLVPPAIAIVRKHPYRWPIVAISLAAGWTGAGYLAALVWAVWPFKTRTSNGVLDLPNKRMNERAIYVLKNQQETGPYREAEIADLLKRGEGSPQDLAWCEGEVEWMPLGRLLSKQERGAVLALPTPSEEKMEEMDELKRIFQMAYYQRATTLCMLLSILAAISGAFFSNENTAFVWTGILAAPALIYGAYAYFRFLFALCRWWTPVLLLISLVPFIVLAVLYISSGIASDIYRNHGLHAGMMGLTRKSFQDLRQKVLLQAD